MSCQNNCQNQTTVTCNTNDYSRGNNGFIIIIVLYILLAIILGSCLF